MPNDHHRIRTYGLRRSRMPMIAFEKLVGDLDESILRVGYRMSLGTEAAVHEYISPVYPLIVDSYLQVLNQIINIFEGRIVNQPEMYLEGNMTRKGRCEYTWIITGGTIILLVELKLNLRSLSSDAYSDIIAQCCAEANGNWLHITFI